MICKKKYGEKNKEEIFNRILREQNPFNESEHEGVLEFLRSVWNLKNLPSEDPRFNDAEGDIIQHTVNNGDWNLRYLFIERLKLFDNEENFIQFVESVVNPQFRIDEEEILKFVVLINHILEKDEFQLNITEYDDEGSPIYTLNEYNLNDSFPVDIKRNDIPFYVIKNTEEIDNWWHSPNRKPYPYPSFILVFNNAWNDYGIKSEFRLHYNDTAGKTHEIENVKITQKEGVILKQIPDEFINLNVEFCSLGQSIDYYELLENLLGNNFIGVLYALRDAAFFPEIQEDFENVNEFRNSLIRYDEQERLLREAKHLIQGADLEHLYSFDYSFKPKFSSERINVNFNLGGTGELPNRVYALIGKNGTGKTQLITALPVDISEKKDDYFHPKIPLFSKVIAVSYSIFDTFKIPKRTVTFNYVYCGLRNEKGDLLSEKGLLLRFHNTWKKILKIERVEQWRVVLLNFLDQEMVDEFILKNNHEYKVSIDGFNRVRRKLSSGQSIILYIISQIVADIRYDSLLLFDEPETHLHPNAITQLMNTIYSLVDEFESYCILATHSPLIIRECFSRNVYVLERHENIPSVRKIGLESFGENLTVLSEEVFGNKDVVKHYKKIIGELVESGKSYEDIVMFIESDDVPLGLNAKIFIKSIISIRNA